jgi:hypothetical protein
MHHDTDWQHVHDELSRIAKCRAHLDWEEGTWLVRAQRCAVHLRLGYASFAEYIERLFGYRPRWTEERLRVAEALEHLPMLAQSLRDGVITWSVVRELTRVASSDNGGCQDCCRMHGYATASMFVGSGLSTTLAMGSQLRVSPVQRSGFMHLAAA